MQNNKKYKELIQSLEQRATESHLYLQDTLE